MPMDGAPQRTPGCRQRSLRQAIWIRTGRRSARAGPPHTSGASGPRPAPARSGRDPANAAWASAGGLERSITGRQLNANRRLVSVVTTESSTIDVTVRSGRRLFGLRPSGWAQPHLDYEAAPRRRANVTVAWQSSITSSVSGSMPRALASMRAVPRPFEPRTPVSLAAPLRPLESPRRVIVNLLRFKVAVPVT